MSSFSTPRYHTAPDALDDRLAVLWAAYTAAALKAQASGRIDDGIAAGKAWAAWLDAFMPMPGVTQPAEGEGEV